MYILYPDERRVARVRELVHENMRVLNFVSLKSFAKPEYMIDLCSWKLYSSFGAVEIYVSNDVHVDSGGVEVVEGPNLSIPDG